MHRDYSGLSFEFCMEYCLNYNMIIIMVRNKISTRKKWI